ncbi:MAG: FliH/SctL family protein [Gemmatimonadota bacterium]
MWAPEELALDTSGLHDALHDALRRADEAEHEPSAPSPDLAFIERAREEAYERGMAEGRRVGDQEATARLHYAVAAVTDALESLNADAEKWVGNAEENICALAIAVARQVIGREVAIDKSALSAMVEQAIGEFPLDQPLTLRVNPQDLPVISAAFHALGESSPLVARKDVQWLADPRIAAGGCLIEGRDRIVDGRVDTALERLYRRLTYTGV